MSFPINGIPKVLAAKTTASALDALAVLSPPEYWNAGEIIKGIHYRRLDSVLSIVDPTRSRVYATTDATTKAAYLATMTPGSYGELRLTPQSAGYNPLWTVLHDDGFPEVALYLNAISKRNIVQIVNKWCRNEFPYQYNFVVVNQDDATVSIRSMGDPNGVSALLNNVNGAGFTVCYELGNLDPERLIFE